MKKLSRIKIVKQINNYLIKNKNRIDKINFKFPEYKLIQISSDGSSISKANTDESIIITLKPKRLYQTQK